MNSPHYLEMPAKMGENGGANGEDNGLWDASPGELLKDWEPLLLHWLKTDCLLQTFKGKKQYS